MDMRKSPLLKAVKEELPDTSDTDTCDSDISFNQMVKLEGVEIEQRGVDIFYDGQIAEMRSNKTEEETKDWSVNDAVHSQISSTNKRSRCGLCGADFFRATSLMVHMSVYHGQDLKKLPSQDSSLNNNKGSHISFYNSQQIDDNLYNFNPESEKAYKCSGCEKMFSRSVDIKTHQELSKGQNVYKCIDCEKKCHRISSNLEGHSDQILYKSIDFKKDKIQLGSSLNGHHLQIEVDKPSQCTNYNNTYTHTCTYCNKAFSSTYYLTEHLNRYKGGKLCKCSDCGKAFHLPSELKKHQRIHTGAYNLYKCTDCGKAFDYLYKLTTHQVIHTGDKPYKCTHCSKAFTRPGTLKAHQHMHTGDKPYKCTDCGKAFCQLKSLKLHQCLHTGDGPCKCTKCDKAFSNRSSFTVHLLKHTGDKPYKCTDCDKAFNEHSYLRAHQRRHMRDQNYSRCAECGNDFISKKKFNKHICVHKCTDCGRTFSRPYNLKRHKEKACTPGKPFK